uniref:Uncharacterized protein n=1 Tax=Bracon brevicornis TaxID=1563983 RepID=A0A6V7IWF1_9HYME
MSEFDMYQLVNIPQTDIISTETDIIKEVYSASHIIQLPYLTAVAWLNMTCGLSRYNVHSKQQIYQSSAMGCCIINLALSALYTIEELKYPVLH